MTEPKPDIAHELKHTLNLLIWSVIILSSVVILITLTAALYASSDRSNLRKEEQRTRNALCSYRDDLGQRLNANKTLLVPAVGETRSNLIITITAQQRAFDSLNDLGCD
jgi:hypothetical protein